MGGLFAATATTLLVLPALFVMLQSSKPLANASLDPLDPDSPLHSAPPAGAT
jgi:hypothetical protein